MPRVALSASLVILASACAAPAPPSPDPPPQTTSSAASVEPPPPPLPREVHAGQVPAGFALDGSIAEWAAVPPSVSRGGLRLWIAGHDKGLVLAGELPDASGAPPASLTVTVTSPRPELPKLGYMRDGSLMSLANEEDCDGVMGDSDVPEERAPAECRAWRLDQLDRRAKIEQRFTRKITVPLRVSGRSFEGLLPVTDLPLVASHLLRSFDVALELPLSWRAQVSLDQPLHLVPEGSLTEQLLKDPIPDKESTLAVCDPAHPDHLIYFFNEARGFSVRPSTPSPDEMVVDLGKRRRVADIGGVVVEELDSVAPPLFMREEGALVSSKGDRVIEVHATGRHRVAGVLRRKPDTADLVLTYVGYYNTFGNGTCGMCPVALLNAQTVTAAGHFEDPWWHEEIGGGPPMELEPTSATATADGRKITVEATTYRVSEDKQGYTHSEETGGVEITLTWSDAKEDFLRKDRKLRPRRPRSTGRR